MGIAFEDDRALQYLRAHDFAPAARRSEKEACIEEVKRICLSETATVVDLGSGNGFLTDVLSESLPETTQIIAVETSEQMIAAAKPHENVQLVNAYLHSTGISSGSVDLVISLAAFHHLTNKTVVLGEVNRILKPAGHCVIVDVLHGTRTQAFFDSVVAETCSSGHDFDFLDPVMIGNFASRSGLAHIASRARATDWEFRSRLSAIDFVKKLLSLRIDRVVLGDAIDSILGTRTMPDGRFFIGWELGFHVLCKI